MPLSKYLSFGEVISLYNAEDLGVGPNWEKAVLDLVNTRRLYPSLWPHGVRHSGVSPKVLILDQNVLFRMGTTRGLDIVAASSGVISTNSDMTSHLAVWSRNIGIGAINCKLSEVERAESKFALFQEGRLWLYDDVPNLTLGQFEGLLGAARQRTSQRA